MVSGIRHLYMQYLMLGFQVILPAWPHNRQITAEQDHIMAFLARSEEGAGSGSSIQIGINSAANCYAAPQLAMLFFGNDERIG
jgi:hypothetical protein